jgi:hypothetical protein
MLEVRTHPSRPPRQYACLPLPLSRVERAAALLPEFILTDLHVDERCRALLETKPIEGRGWRAVRPSRSAHELVRRVRAMPACLRTEAGTPASRSAV